MASGSGPAFLAVDWGTTHLRASLVDDGGAVLDRTHSDQGVQSVPSGGFQAAFEATCGPWLRAHPGLPVLMAGMVGSRNGWIEAPYAPCPCGPADLAARLLPVPGMDGVSIVPGVDHRSPDGTYDVMRGEEAKVIGTDIADGLVCLPGTHGKWVVVDGGRITRFATFITGELYAALSQSFVGRLAQAPDDPAGAGILAATALRAGGGLTRAAFQARSRVLSGDMRPSAVRPFLSALLIEAELEGAATLFPGRRHVRLVAAEPQLGLYRAALTARGFEVTTVDPGTAMLAGLARIMAAKDNP